jgi:hypothetical protein
MEQERRSGGRVHGSPIAKETEELEAECLAGLFLPGADVERGREGSGGHEVGVHGPEGEQVELVGGAVEVLFVEVDDLVDQVVAVGIGGFGGHVHLLWRKLLAEKATSCWLPASSYFALISPKSFWLSAIAKSRHKMLWI